MLNTAILFFIAAIASAYVCRTIARERGAALWFWTAFGILLGPLAIPFVFFAKPTKVD